ncbi:MAG: hypothetical protein HEP71_26965 [Roseivirga sp.]|nr:hypothetical protein [Roseivirga sp.]
MTRYILPIILLSVFSCTSNTQDQDGDWALRSTENIFHSENGNEKIQIVYSTQHMGVSSYTDTSIIAQQYMDTLLLDEVWYNLTDGDTIKWSHAINKFSSEGLLIEEIDSVNGTLRSHFLSFYENSLLQKQESLAMIPGYNDQGEITGYDTLKSVNHYYYDGNNRLINAMTLERDELSFQLARVTKFDTTFTYNQFDERGNIIQRVSISNRDTTSVSMTEYDELDREIKSVMASLDLGTSTITSEYDDRGNVISELHILDAFSILTLTEFDEQNRPVVRRIYEPKNSY